MAWACDSCNTDYADDALLWCAACSTMRYRSFAVMVAEHVLEHLADGQSEPLDVLKALQDRPIKAYGSLTLAFVAQQMRLLTKDTRTLARQLAQARAASMMLNAVQHGSVAEQLTVLKGIQVLGDVQDVRIDQTTRFVIENHEGPPPPRPAGSSHE
jgi:hypothetical protein